MALDPVLTGENWAELRSSRQSEQPGHDLWSDVREFRVELPEAVTSPFGAYDVANPPLPHLGDDHPNSLVKAQVASVSQSWFAPPDHQHALVTVFYESGPDNSSPIGRGKRKVLWTTNGRIENITVTVDEAGEPIDGGATIPNGVLEYVATMKHAASLTAAAELSVGAINQLQFRKYPPRSAMFVGADTELIHGHDTTVPGSSKVVLKFLCKQPLYGLPDGAWDLVVPKVDDMGQALAGEFETRRLPHLVEDFKEFFPVGWDHGLGVSGAGG